MTRQIITTKQVVFDESFFPYCKKELITRMHEGGDKLNILYKASSLVKWLE